LLEALPYFGGRPTDQALDTIGAEEGIGISRALIRRLADFEILVPPPSG
jgi:hypothetical protein